MRGGKGGGRVDGRGESGREGWRGLIINTFNDDSES